MAGTSSKPGRDHSMDFRGFLNNLQGRDHLFNEKGQKSKGQTQEAKKSVPLRNIGKTNDDQQPPRKVPGIEITEKTHAASKFSLKDHDARYNHMEYSNAASNISGSFSDDERTPDAASEKELGNEYFKQKKFHEAIECYSRSIALSPTSVAFANRAMAYIKIKRFEEAESDCSEALNLDDRYVKAYSRRATARKELGKLEASLEDSEFAMRLELNNQELRKQYTETKALYEKEITKKIAGTSKSSKQGIQKPEILETRATDIQGVHSASRSNFQDTVPIPVKSSNTESNGKTSSRTLSTVEEADSKSMNTGVKTRVELLDRPLESAPLNSIGDNSKERHDASHKDKLSSSVQDLASRAASLMTATTGKHITAPKSAYQFEVSWRAVSDDYALQAQLLKTIQPSDFPLIFKNALSAPMLIDIIRCTASFFREETDLGVSTLENLAKVPRFDMIVMCLSAVDRSELHRLWDEVFTSTDVQPNQIEALKRLRSRYCYGQVRDIYSELMHVQKY